MKTKTNICKWVHCHLAHQKHWGWNVLFLCKTTRAQPGSACPPILPVLWRAVTLRLLWIGFQHFTLCPFNTVNHASEEVFSANFMSSKTLPPFSPQPLSSLTSVSVPLPRLSGSPATRVSSTAARSTFHSQPFFSRIPFILDTRFISSVITCDFFAALSSLLTSSLLIIYFVKWHTESRGQHNCTLCCVCIKWVRDAQWSVTDKLLK